MERVDCTVKEYAWGKDGPQSEVARLFSAGHTQFKIGHKTPYAELWIGTHPDGPARVRKSSECLSRLIARSSNQEQQKKQALEEVHLPFIMKIMSIKHTLSLQVHPTKEQAAILHKKDPFNYPDRNHKPELAYALTRFELLCGFRPAHQIAENMKVFPELRKVMGEDNCKKFEQLLPGSNSKKGEEKLKAALRKCFSTMLDQQLEKPKMVEEQLKSLYRRIDSNVRGFLIEETIAVMKDTYQRFPSDVGCFAPLYLNHMILQPGECCFYAAEELHAYLSGECVECVGCSNNTIRAALTPKYIDRENLVKVLNYRMTDPKFYMVLPTPLPNYPHIVEYAPDCKDFTLHQITVPDTSTSVELPALQCASMIVIVEGEAEFLELDSSIQSENINNNSNRNAEPSSCAVKRGDIYYIPAGKLVCFTSVASQLLGYRTFSYEAGPDHSNRLAAMSKQAKMVPNLPAMVEKKGKEKINYPLKMSQKSVLNDDKASQNIFFGMEEEKEDKKKMVMFDVETEMDGFM